MDLSRYGNAKETPVTANLPSKHAKLAQSCARSEALESVILPGIEHVGQAHAGGEGERPTSFAW